MGSSKPIQPRFLVPPDIGGLRPDVARLLQNSLTQYGMGGSPFSAPISPLQNTATQQYSSLLNGQNLAGIAGQGLQQQIETGFNIDTSPLVKQAQNTFSRDIAPGIKESLGANYGIRFGTPVAESLSRAGADVSTNLNAALAGYANEAANRRAAGVGQGFNLLGAGQSAGLAESGQNAANMDRFLQTILSGTGLLSGQSQFANPQFGPNQNLQTIQALAAIASAVAAFA